LDELDFNLPALAARLVIVVVVVVDVGGALPFDAAVGVASLNPIAIAESRVVVARRRIAVVFSDFGRHDGGSNEL